MVDTLSYIILFLSFGVIGTVDSSHYLSPRNQEWLNDSALLAIIDVYLEYLITLGYSHQSVCTYSSGVAHFSYWLGKKKIPIDHIIESVVDRFLFKHLPVCNCSYLCRRSLFSVRAALKHLLVVMRREGLLKPSITNSSDEIEKELNSYNDYLDEVRGLTKSSRANQIFNIEKFLVHKFANRPVKINLISGKDIQSYFSKVGKSLKPSSLQCLSGTVRSYLRYRAHLGDHTEPLIGVVPTAAQWRLAALPKALTSSQIDKLLTSIDRSTTTGQRDYAIMCCLLDLGLRAGEVARLRIEDVDWQNSALQIRNSKGRRNNLLPLPAKTGEALVDYLQRGRPKTTCRSLFVRHRGPVNLAMTSGTICGRVRVVSSRCDGVPVIGAHICRHTAACQMLSAGANLKDIADVLRHRRLDTTMVYAKIDFNRLNFVVAPWPGTEL